MPEYKPKRRICYDECPFNFAPTEFTYAECGLGITRGHCAKGDPCNAPAHALRDLLAFARDELQARGLKT